MKFSPCGLGMIMKYPDEFVPLLKLMVAIKRSKKGIPQKPHWVFCYTMLYKASRSLAIVIQHLEPELRNVVCIFYLVLRALDTVEDDTSIPTDVKVPILMDFHKLIYDRDWHFACGRDDCKVLMDEFHQVSAALSELQSSYQKAIEDVAMKMGAGMAKFICKEVETTDDFYEYCHYAAGLVGLGLSKLFHAAKLEDLAPEYLSNSMGLFLQQANVVRDYLEDINEIPKSRMFWPREVWSKYVNNLEDLKHEDNSAKAVECLNEMVTNSLVHASDSLQYLSNLKNSAVFRFCAIPQIIAIGTLALCYNNIQVFRGAVTIRPGETSFLATLRGLAAKVIDRTKSMSDIYDAFYDFSSVIKAKVDKNDPTATKTLSRIEAIQKVCRDSGNLNKRKSYISESNPTLIIILVITVSARVTFLLTTTFIPQTTDFDASVLASPALVS